MRNKIKKISDFLSGLPMTIVGGAALLLSFLLPRINNLSWQNLIHWHYYYRGRIVHGGAEIWENLAWITVAVCGLPLVYLAVYRLIHNKGLAKISSCLLISIAMFASIWIGDLFAAGEVAFIMAIGAILEDMTTHRAEKGLRNLMSLSPKEGRRVIADGQTEMIPLDAIRVGDVLRVLPGEVIPADGVILSGETSVDQSIMTGESLPVDKAADDEVFCGTINRFGSIDFRASKVGADSSLERLIHLVKDAENRQAPVQRIADRWASMLVPVALLISLAAYWITGELERMVTVMVVFCPCALVLATPTAVMAAIGQAAKHGVIIKSGEALERLGGIHVIAFDKTGTLTQGSLKVSDILPFGAMTTDKLIMLAASAEEKSEHPAAKAIVSCAKEKGLSIPESSGFQMSAGRGAEAKVNGKQLYCGNEEFAREHGIIPDEAVYNAMQTLRNQGKAVVLIGRDHEILGILALSDAIRPNVPAIVEQLSDMKVRSVLLTGDHRNTADWFAAQAGIAEFHAGLLPEDKVSYIDQARKKGPVCMVGDGVNDAPALKLADVGVAMGCMGSDIAVEAADVALMTDELSRIPYLKWLSNTTVATIRLCITISMCINAAAVTLSVLGLLTPTTGALAHNVGSTFVVLMAALLYDRKYKEKHT